MGGLIFIHSVLSALFICPHSHPRRLVPWLLSFTEETEGGQVGPLSAQEVAVPGFECGQPGHGVHCKRLIPKC